jgi:hypothetical protein
LDRAKPYLQEAGLSNEDWIKIEILVICTDVSGDTSEIPSPASIAREIYMGKSSEVDSFYKPLSENPKLSVMVTLLQEADLARSSGLNYKFSMEMTRLIAEETKVLTPSASTLYGFMHYICHGGYLSTAGNFLLGDNFQSILLEAENDKEKGVLYA